MQSTLTNFVYVNPQWKKNAEEERLLGVSVTGATDHFVLKNVSETAEDWLRELRKIAVDTNRATAELLGINPSVAITLNKPSGTVSQLVDSASGLHARYSPYYIRRVRADAKDPLAQVMQQQGYPWEYADGSTTTLVFSFPVKSPEGAVFRDDRTATEQLEYWMMWKKNWCDSHNPSVTIYVKEHEWLEVGAWVYKNFDDICGLSFLPHSDHVYKQAPYTECTKDQYEALLAKMPKGIDYEALSRLETTDQTTGTQEYACVSGACDLI
jgi:ribonucleoside-diphosphate reductase alpha chain